MKALYFLIPLFIFLTIVQLVDYFGIWNREQLYLDGYVLPVYAAVDTDMEEKELQEEVLSSFDIHYSTSKRSTYDREILPATDDRIEIIGDFDFQEAGAKKIILNIEGAKVSLCYFVCDTDPITVSTYEELVQVAGEYNYIKLNNSIEIPEGEELYFGHFCRLDVPEGSELYLNGVIEIGHTMSIYGNMTASDTGDLIGFIKVIDGEVTITE